MSCNKCLCETTVECSEICTALTVVNAWNVPSCNNQAVLSVPGLYNVLIGSYIWNPTYGWFKVVYFDSINRQITVLNECITSNAAPGTVVPADSTFVFGAPPGSTSVTYSEFGIGTGYTLTSANGEIIFSTVSPAIVLTQPGTYLILGGMQIVNTNVQSSTNIVINGGMRRTNNSPLDINAHNMRSFTPPGSVYTLSLGYSFMIPAIYTTVNTNDRLTLAGYYNGTITSGTLNVDAAFIRAIKLY